jgi:hypothetical protein
MGNHITVEEESEDENANNNSTTSSASTGQVNAGSSDTHFLFGVARNSKVLFDDETKKILQSTRVEDSAWIEMLQNPEPLFENLCVPAEKEGKRRYFRVISEIENALYPQAIAELPDEAWAPSVWTDKEDNEEAKEAADIEEDIVTGIAPRDDDDGIRYAVSAHLHTLAQLGGHSKLSSEYSFLLEMRIRIMRRIQRAVLREEQRALLNTQRRNDMIKKLSNDTKSKKTFADASMVSCVRVGMVLLRTAAKSDPSVFYEVLAILQELIADHELLSIFNGPPLSPALEGSLARLCKELLDIANSHSGTDTTESQSAVIKVLLGLALARGSFSMLLTVARGLIGFDKGRTLSNLLETEKDTATAPCLEGTDSMSQIEELSNFQHRHELHSFLPSLAKGSWLVSVKDREKVSARIADKEEGGNKGKSNLGPVTFKMDSGNCGAPICISEDGLTITHTDSSYHTCAVVGTYEFTSGVHYWEVVLDGHDGGCVLTGIHAIDCKVDNVGGAGTFWKDASKGSAIGYNVNGKLMVNGSTGSQHKKCALGSAIGVLLDLNNGKISFYVDNEFQCSQEGITGPVAAASSLQYHTDAITYRFPPCPKEVSTSISKVALGKGMPLVQSAGTDSGDEEKDESSKFPATAMTCDGRFIYLYCPTRGLVKIGSGLPGSDTLAGRVYAERPGFHTRSDADESKDSSGICFHASLACVGKYLFFRSPDIAPAALEVIDCETLKLAKYNSSSRNNEKTSLVSNSVFETISDANPEPIALSSRVDSSASAVEDLLGDDLDLSKPWLEAEGGEWLDTAYKWLRAKDESSGAGEIESKSNDNDEAALESKEADKDTSTSTSSNERARAVTNLGSEDDNEINGKGFRKSPILSDGRSLYIVHQEKKTFVITNEEGDDAESEMAEKLFTYVEKYDVYPHLKHVSTIRLKPRRRMQSFFKNDPEKHTDTKQGRIIHAINCGGLDHVGSDEINYVADHSFHTTSSTPFTPSSRGSTTSSISPSSYDKVLFQSCREHADTFWYDLSVPNGSYVVKLEFAEITASSSNQREFNILVNGRLHRVKYDPYSVKSKKNYVDPNALMAAVTVTNKRLVIKFETPENSKGGMVSTIVVRENIYSDEFIHAAGRPGISNNNLLSKSLPSNTEDPFDDLSEGWINKAQMVLNGEELMIALPSSCCPSFSKGYAAKKSDYLLAYVFSLRESRDPSHVISGAFLRKHYVLNTNGPLSYDIEGNCCWALNTDESRLLCSSNASLAPSHGLHGSFEAKSNSSFFNIGGVVLTQLDILCSAYGRPGPLADEIIFSGKGRSSSAQLSNSMDFCLSSPLGFEVCPETFATLYDLIKIGLNQFMSVCSASHEDGKSTILVHREHSCSIVLSSLRILKTHIIRLVESNVPLSQINLKPVAEERKKSLFVDTSLILTDLRDILTSIYNWQLADVVDDFNGDKWLSIPSEIAVFQSNMRSEASNLLTAGLNVFYPSPNQQAQLLGSALQSVSASRASLLNAKASQSSETQRRELNVQLNFLNSLFQRFSEFEMILQLLSSLEKPAKNSASLLNLLVSDCRTTALNLINQVAEDVDTEAHFTASLASPSRVRSIDHGNDESSTALAPFNDESSPSASSKSARLLLSLQMQIITQFDSLSLWSNHSKDSSNRAFDMIIDHTKDCLNIFVSILDTAKKHLAKMKDENQLKKIASITCTLAQPAAFVTMLHSLLTTLCSFATDVRISSALLPFVNKALLALSTTLKMLIYPLPKDAKAKEEMPASPMQSPAKPMIAMPSENGALCFSTTHYAEAYASLAAMQHTLSWLGGRCASSLIIGDEVNSDEKGCAPWLQSRLFLGDLQRPPSDASRQGTKAAAAKKIISESQSKATATTEEAADKKTGDEEKQSVTSPKDPLPPPVPLTTQLSFDLESPPALMSAPSLTRSRSAIQEEVNFIDDLLDGINLGEVFIKHVDADAQKMLTTNIKFRLRANKKKGGKVIDDAIRTIGAAMLYQEHLVVSAVAFSLSCQSEGGKDHVSQDDIHDLATVWSIALQARLWFINKREKTGMSYEEIAARVTQRCLFLLRLKPQQDRQHSLASPSRSLKHHFMSKSDSIDSQSGESPNDENELREGRSLKTLSQIVSVASKVHKLRSILEKRRATLSNNIDVGDKDSRTVAVLKFVQCVDGKNAYDITRVEMCVKRRRRRAEMRIMGLRGIVNLIESIGHGGMEGSESLLDSADNCSDHQVSLIQVLRFIGRSLRRTGENGTMVLGSVLHELEGCGPALSKQAYQSWKNVFQHMLRFLPSKKNGIMATSVHPQVKMLAMESLCLYYPPSFQGFVAESNLLETLRSMMQWSPSGAGKEWKAFLLNKDGDSSSLPANAEKSGTTGFSGNYCIYGPEIAESGVWGTKVCLIYEPAPKDGFVTSISIKLSRAPESCSSPDDALELHIYKETSTGNFLLERKTEVTGIDYNSTEKQTVKVKNPVKICSGEFAALVNQNGDLRTTTRDGDCEKSTVYYIRPSPPTIGNEASFSKWDGCIGWCPHVSTGGKAGRNHVATTAPKLEVKAKPKPRKDRQYSDIYDELVKHSSTFADITNGVSHSGVTCDECGMSPIRGARWKCAHSSCPDFDLCTECFNKGLHNLEFPYYCYAGSTSSSNRKMIMSRKKINERWEEELKAYNEFLEQTKKVKTIEAPKMTQELKMALQIHWEREAARACFSALMLASANPSSICLTPDVSETENSMITSKDDAIGETPPRTHLQLQLTQTPYNIDYGASLFSMLNNQLKSLHDSGEVKFVKDDALAIDDINITNISQLSDQKNMSKLTTFNDGSNPKCQLACESPIYLNGAENSRFSSFGIGGLMVPQVPLIRQCDENNNVKIELTVSLSVFIDDNGRDKLAYIEYGEETVLWSIGYFPDKSSQYVRKNDVQAIVKLAPESMTLSFEYRDGLGCNLVSISSAPVPIDQWSHLVFTKASDGLHIWIDGKESDRKSSSIWMPLVPSERLSMYVKPDVNSDEVVPVNEKHGIEVLRVLTNSTGVWVRAKIKNKEDKAARSSSFILGWILAQDTVKNVIHLSQVDKSETEKLVLERKADANIYGGVLGSGIYVINTSTINSETHNLRATPSLDGKPETSLKNKTEIKIDCMGGPKGVDGQHEWARLSIDSPKNSGGLWARVRANGSWLVDIKSKFRNPCPSRAAVESGVEGHGIMVVNASLVQGGKHNIRPIPSLNDNEPIGQLKNKVAFAIDLMGGDKGSDGLHEWGRLAKTTSNNFGGHWAKVRNGGRWLVTVKESFQECKADLLCSTCQARYKDVFVPNPFVDESYLAREDISVPLYIGTPPLPTPYVSRGDGELSARYGEPFEGFTGWVYNVHVFDYASNRGRVHDLLETAKQANKFIRVDTSVQTSRNFALKWVLRLLHHCSSKEVCHKICNVGTIKILLELVGIRPSHSRDISCTSLVLQRHAVRLLRRILPKLEVSIGCRAMNLAQEKPSTCSPTDFINELLQLVARHMAITSCKEQDSTSGTNVADLPPVLRSTIDAFPLASELVMLLRALAGTSLWAQHTNLALRDRILMIPSLFSNDKQTPLDIDFWFAFATLQIIGGHFDYLRVGTKCLIKPEAVKKDDEVVEKRVATIVEYSIENDCACIAEQSRPVDDDDDGASHDSSRTRSMRLEDVTLERLSPIADGDIKFLAVGKGNITEDKEVYAILNQLVLGSFGQTSSQNEACLGLQLLRSIALKSLSAIFDQPKAAKFVAKNIPSLVCDLVGISIKPANIYRNFGDIAQIETKLQKIQSILYETRPSLQLLTPPTGDEKEEDAKPVSCSFNLKAHGKLIDVQKADDEALCPTFNMSANHLKWTCAQCGFLNDASPGSKTARWDECDMCLCERPKANTSAVLGMRWPSKSKCTSILKYDGTLRHMYAVRSAGIDFVCSECANWFLENGHDVIWRGKSRKTCKMSPSTSVDEETSIHLDVKQQLKSHWSNACSTLDRDYFEVRIDKMDVGNGGEVIIGLAHEDMFDGKDAVDPLILECKPNPDFCFTYCSNGTVQHRDQDTLTRLNDVKKIKAAAEENLATSTAFISFQTLTRRWEAMQDEWSLHTPVSLLRRSFPCVWNHSARDDDYFPVSLAAPLKAGPAVSNASPALLVANYPVTLDVSKNQSNAEVTNFYFEVFIEVESSSIAIGFLSADQQEIYDGHLGWQEKSIGYHSDNGGLFSGARDKKATCTFETFGKGDTIGAGINLASGDMFLTKNGQLLEASCFSLASGSYLPSLTARAGAVIHGNFGSEPFKYMSEEKKQERAPEKALLNPSTETTWKCLEANFNVYLSPKKEDDVVKITEKVSDISVLEQVENDEGTWLKLSSSSKGSLIEISTENEVKQALVASDAWVMAKMKDSSETTLTFWEIIDKAETEDTKIALPISIERASSLELLFGSSEEETISYPSVTTKWICRWSGGVRVRASHSLSAKVVTTPFPYKEIAFGVMTKKTSEGTWIKLAPQSMKEKNITNDEAWVMVNHNKDGVLFEKVDEETQGGVTNAAKSPFEIANGLDILQEAMNLSVRYARFTEGDTIGIGRDYRKNEIYITKNGRRLGSPFDNVNGFLVPSVWMKGAGTSVSVNNGTNPLFPLQYTDAMSSASIPTDVIVPNSILRGIYRPAEGKSMPIHLSVENRYASGDFTGSLSWPDLGRIVEVSGTIKGSGTVLMRETKLKSGSGFESFMPNPIGNSGAKYKLFLQKPTVKAASNTNSDKELDIAKHPLRTSKSTMYALAGGRLPGTATSGESKGSLTGSGYMDYIELVLGYDAVSEKGTSFKTAPSNALVFSPSSGSWKGNNSLVTGPSNIFLGLPKGLCFEDKTELSLEAWVCMMPQGKESTSKQMILSYGNGGADSAQIFLRTSCGNYECGSSYHSKDGFVSTIATSKIPESDYGTWIHLAAVYVDGEEQDRRNTENKEKKEKKKKKDDTKDDEDGDRVRKKLSKNCGQWELYRNGTRVAVVVHSEGAVAVIQRTKEDVDAELEKYKIDGHLSAVQKKISLRTIESKAKTFNSNSVGPSIISRDGTNGGWSIGARVVARDNGSRYACESFAGAIEMVRMWDTALPLQNIHEGAFGRSKKTAKHLVGCWIPSGAGRVLFDNGPFSLHGLIHDVVHIPCPLSYGGGSTRMAWDADNCGKHLTVSEDGSSAKHTGSSSNYSNVLGTVGFTSGVHEWAVKINKASSRDMFIGIATKDMSLSKYCGNDKHGWGYYGSTNKTYHNSSGKTYGKQYKEGDTIGVRLDCDAGTVEFSKNGEWWGVAYTESIFTEEPIFPVASMYKSNMEMEFLHNMTISSSQSSTGDSLTIDDLWAKSLRAQACQFPETWDFSSWSAPAAVAIAELSESADTTSLSFNDRISAEFSTAFGLGQNIASKSLLTAQQHVKQYASISSSTDANHGLTIHKQLSRGDVSYAIALELHALSHKKMIPTSADLGFSLEEKQEESAELETKEADADESVTTGDSLIARPQLQVNVPELPNLSLPSGDLGNNAITAISDSWDGAFSASLKDKKGKLTSKDDESCLDTVNQTVFAGGPNWQQELCAQMAHSCESLSILQSRQALMALLKNWPDSIDLNSETLGGGESVCAMLTLLGGKDSENIDHAMDEKDTERRKTSENNCDIEVFRKKLVEICCTEFACCASGSPVKLNELPITEVLTAHAMNHMMGIIAVESMPDVKALREKKKTDKSKGDNFELLNCDYATLLHPNRHLAFWIFEMLSETNTIPHYIVPPLASTIVKYIAISEGDDRIRAIRLLTSMATAPALLERPQSERLIISDLFHKPFSGHMNELYKNDKSRCSSYMSCLLELEVALRLLRSHISAEQAEDTKEDVAKYEQPEWFEDVVQAVDFLDALSLHQNAVHAALPPHLQPHLKDAAIQYNMHLTKKTCETEHPYQLTTFTSKQVSLATGVYTVTFAKETEVDSGHYIMFTEDEEGLRCLDCCKPRSGTSVDFFASSFYWHFPVSPALTFDTVSNPSVLAVRGNIVKVTAAEKTGSAKNVSACIAQQGFTEGVHEWKIQVICKKDSKLNIRVGVTLSKSDAEKDKTHLGGNEKTWGFSSDGKLFNDNSFTAGGPSFNPQDELSLRLDLKNNQISLSVNDSSFSSAKCFSLPTSATSSSKSRYLPAITIKHFEKGDRILLTSKVDPKIMTAGTKSTKKGLTMTVACKNDTASTLPAEFTETFAKNMSLFNSPNVDSQLVSLINGQHEKHKDKGKHFVTLDTFDVEKDTKAHYQLLHKVEDGAMRTRFLVMEIFNEKLTKLLSLIDLSQANTPRSLASKLLRVRGLIYTQMKLSQWSKAIDSTFSSGSMPNIRVNRMKAMTADKNSPPSPTTLDNSVFGQIFKQLHFKSPVELRQKHRAWHIDFDGESSIDAGGPYREALTQIVAELEAPHIAMMIPCHNRKHKAGLQGRDMHVPNPRYATKKHMDMYTFIGKLMGIAIRSHNPIVLNLPSLIWKLIINDVATREDLRAIDTPFIKQMDEIMEAEGLTEEEFDAGFADDLRFVVHDSCEREIELFEGGSDTPVTYRERLRYVKLCEEFRLKEFEKYAAAFRTGLGTIVPVRLLLMWSWEELKVRVTGKPGFDLSHLKKHTRYNDSWNESSKQIVWMWDALESFTPQEQERFLRFVWGRSRLPLGDDGWDNPFTISSCHRRGQNALPETHTCFFQLDLPKYESAEVLRERLHYAFTYCIAIDTD